MRDDCSMSNWKVQYRDRFDLVRSSSGNASKEAALQHARDLYRNQRAEIYRLVGPDGQVMAKGDVMSWVYAHRW
jgi:hypothetical protein